MAKIFPVIVPAKVLKGGKHKIRISVSHNGETRYIVTDIIIDSEKEFKNGTIVKRFDAAALNAKLRNILLTTQKSLDEIEYADGLSCPELVTLIKHGNRAVYITFGELFDEFISVSRAGESSLRVYKNLWHTMPDTLKTLRVSNLTFSSLLATEKFLTKNGNKSASIRNKMLLLKQMVTFAVNSGYANFRINPFANYKVPKMPIRDAWLTVEEIKAIRDFKAVRSIQAFYRDMFMLSYYLGGINMADLIKMRFVKDQAKIKYTRQKTQYRIGDQNVEFELPDEARNIINKYIRQDGALFRQKYAYSVSNAISSSLSSIAKALDIPNLIFYSARKSFSQHAFELGINTNIIDYILGHSVNRRGSCIYHYINVTPQMATNALRKVLDNLK